jgi:hypothetical protein
MLPLGLPWATHHLAISPQGAQHLRTISPLPIDRRVQARTRRRYGRTTPGTAAQDRIPIKTTHGEVTAPGSTERDRVSHSGDSADGGFLQTLNLTALHTGWSESQEVMGRSQTAVRPALEELRQALPCALRGADSDNGSEFIHAHLFRYGDARAVQVTRGWPHTKDDNAHIEQKSGRTSARSWAGTGTTRPRRSLPSTTSTATSSAS